MFLNCTLFQEALPRIAPSPDQPLRNPGRAAHEALIYSFWLPWAVLHCSLPAPAPCSPGAAAQPRQHPAAAPRAHRLGSALLTAHGPGSWEPWECQPRVLVFTFRVCIQLQGVTSQSFSARTPLSPCLQSNGPAALFALSPIILGRYFIFSLLCKNTQRCSRSLLTGGYLWVPPFYSFPSKVSGVDGWTAPRARVEDQTPFCCRSPLQAARRPRRQGPQGRGWRRLSNIPANRRLSFARCAVGFHPTSSLL